MTSHKFKIFFTMTLALALVALGLSSCASSKTGGDVYGGLGLPSAPVPFMTEARTGTLPSGLRYYILENSMPKDRAFLTLAVNAGSTLETEGERGLAHFVEHMAFNGTTRFPESELINYLRSLGMRFGPEANAFTSFDQTIYGIEVPVEAGDNGIKRIPATALAVIDDWSRAITFDPKDVDDERAVVLEEYRTRLGAGERLQRQYMPLLFKGSIYAERLPIGLPEIIQSAPASALVNFYKKWYRADNMALILVGDFDGAALEASLGANFSIPAPDTALDRPYFEVPPPQKGSLETGIFTDSEFPYTLINLFYKQPLQARGKDLESFRKGMIGNLISRMLSLRFQEAVMDPAAPYADVGTYEMRYGRMSGFYTMAVVAKPGSAAPALQALLGEKEKMRRYGFTNTEIDRAKASIISDLKRRMSEKDKLESNGYVDMFTQHFLQDQVYPGYEWELDAAIKLLPGISAKDIAAAAKDYFAADDLTVIILAPEAEAANLPGDAELRRMISASRRMRVQRPREARDSGERLMDAAPLPGAVIAESFDESAEAVRWELDNGARVILKETANKNDEIVLYALARGGYTAFPLEDAVSGELASDMLEVSGAGAWSRIELEKKLSDKQVSYSHWLAPFYRGLQGSSTAEDLQILFEIIHLGFTSPRMDSAAVQAMMEQYRTSLAQAGENPDSVFSREIMKVYYSGNPYFKSLETEDLPKADMNRAMEIIRQGLNPADWTFVFTGNLDLDTLRYYVETYIGSIPALPLPWNSFADIKVDHPGKMETIIYKGKEERSLVYMNWTRKEAFSEKIVAEQAILSEYLDILLTEEIREKLGGVYGISVNVSFQLVPNSELILESSFICDPRRVRELAAATEAQIRQTAQGAIDSSRFVKAVEAVKKEWETTLESNLQIAQRFANYEVLFDLPLDTLKKRPALYDAVKPADIQALCARVLENGPLLGILYPEGWKE